jgi:hypothetical protein
MIDLARAAAGAAIADGPTPEVRQASWPASRAPSEGRRAAFLGGVGLARLSVGGPEDGLDIELKGMGNLGSLHVTRLALRASVGGRIVLDDLDDQSPTRSGWGLVHGSHNAVVVDGLNQRETPPSPVTRRRGPIPLLRGRSRLQVVAAEIRSRTRSRPRPIARSSWPRAAPGPLRGGRLPGRRGLAHDQIYHGPAGGRGRWTRPCRRDPGRVLAGLEHPLSVEGPRGGRSLVRPGPRRIPRLEEARASAPSTATLVEPGRPGSASTCSARRRAPCRPP